MSPLQLDAEIGANGRGTSAKDPRTGEFDRMLEAFRRRGGVACGDEIAAGLRRLSIDQPISCLAHWIVSRTVISFEWQSQLLLPLFQFASDMALREPIAHVNAELRDCLDDFELAGWFVRRSPWLQARAPVDCVEHEPAAVLNAARADRYILRG